MINMQVTKRLQYIRAICMKTTGRVKVLEIISHFEALNILIPLWSTKLACLFC